jgi:predicted GH43/DUF377 family glycosyl hydrolase
MPGVLPSGAPAAAAADRVSLYCGGADTAVGLAHAHLSELVAFARGR